MRTLAAHMTGIELSVRATGDPAVPLIRILHAFADRFAASAVMLAAYAGRFHAVAPDQPALPLRARRSRAKPSQSISWCATSCPGVGGAPAPSPG